MPIPMLAPLVTLVALSLATGAPHRHALVATPAADTVLTAPPRDTVRTPPPANEVREYVGTYSSGFEISWFEPCGAAFGDSPWWVTLGEEARLQRDSLVKLLPVRPTEGLAVRWRATVSPKMPAGAGHMGRGTRYMFVTKIISVRALGPGRGGACDSVAG